MMRPLVAAAVAAAIAAGSSCKNFDPPPPPPFKIFVKVESDPGKALPGAVVIRKNKTLATTGPDGRAMLTIAGAEGEVTDVIIHCPEAYQSPAKPVGIRLTRIADGTKVPEYNVSCPPTLRRVVVAVKAENGANLPVVYLNRRVTRTDASGAAHFALQVAPGTQFQVTLDTSEQGDRLKPKSPSKPFTVGRQDDILLFEQTFQVKKKKRRVYRPHIPRKID